MRFLPLSCAALLGVSLLLAGCEARPGTAPPADATPDSLTVAERVPAWAQDAIFYQLFPERFRNGDPTNDPTRASLETPLDRVPTTWQVSPWTGDWYARAEWEQQRGDDFYEDGVFDRRYGGDLQGVIDQLDYLRDLGINAIYFNPVFYGRSLHKYDGNSFHHVDPYFGPDPEGDLALIEGENAQDPDEWVWTAADSLFLQLLDEAKARDIRIIIDGVFNHTGRDFFAFQDLQERGPDSPYADWYVVRSWDDPATPDTNEFDYEGWWGVETLPVFADASDSTDLHPGPKQYIFDATARWMDPNGDGDPSDGIDGWRLDVAEEVPIGFWADWNAHVQRLNPDAYTVTEIWEDASTFLREGGFSATMNYYGFAFPVKGFLVDNAASPSRFAELLNTRRGDYPEPVQHALQNLIDSHDTDRVASMIVNAGGEDYARADRYDYDWNDRVSPRHGDAYEVRAPNAEERQVQRLVALFQMTYVGAPMIYYGTEAGMWGADDPDDRKPMVWPDLEYDPETHDPLGRARPADPVAFDSSLFSYYQDIIALRTEHPAFRAGTFQVLTADNERDTFGFSRTHDGEAFVVVLNRSDDAHSLRVPLPEALLGDYDVALTTHDAAHRVQQDAEALLLEVPARTGLVLRRSVDGS